MVQAYKKITEVVWHVMRVKEENMCRYGHTRERKKRDARPKVDKLRIREK